jgi:3-deoxy-D-manno-octulosonic-acid transferase
VNSLYYFLSSVLYLISLPLLIILSFKKKYNLSIPQRFFPFTNKKFTNNNIWFHSCSLGETKALSPLVKKFENVNISVITNTGYEEAKKFKNADVRFLPFEIFLPFWIKPCKALVVMEAELWLMMFFIAKRRCQKTILINARISDRSYPKYRKFKWFYSHLFQYIDTIFAQSETDRERLVDLGAKNVIVAGNIKTASNIEIKKEYKKPNNLVITAGSTHENEEELILNAYKNSNLDATLYIVPRHPERFESVYELIKDFSEKNSFTYSRIDENRNTDIILVDKIGELINIYAISDIVILGGGFEKIGGHNPLEVAHFNKILISGKEIFNSYTLFENVNNYYLIEKEDLTKYLQNYEQLEKSSIKNRVNLDLIIDNIKP